ncbi:hypothetical protein KDA_26560 [Dictyobacter alpinus]|uniref:Methyltransferase type 11 domain-containing protein n=1 Tax=Dictyobacter alpinus TaxID=2014873 RepID=A0A402B775_9CHLR|nr:methyltransferase domain-containing protein [Dictyobacter alpinus]GCE27172.1 hypothetical protein KDA_26560 [Dictyobacter alpinus]
MASSDVPAQSDVLFENPFSIEDLLVFDQDTLHHMLACGDSQLSRTLLAHGLHGASSTLISHITKSLSPEQQQLLQDELRHPLPTQEAEQARKELLDHLFWELVYWKTPDLYEELTEGERLHEGIFQAIQPDLAGKVVLDAGAGSGRASFECVRFGAEKVYAVEPSPGLLHLLRQKVRVDDKGKRIQPQSGRFTHLPVPDQSIDTVISCSAFTALDDQGGEPGLAELRRVTKPGGKIIIIWPRTEDLDWFEQHGFHYVSMPVQGEMYIYFRSFECALRIAHLFYGHNPAVVDYLQKVQKPEIPFSVIGMNPPRDYFWLAV